LDSNVLIKIYTINTWKYKEKETTDGSPDQNVFDIMQGVIEFIIKQEKKNKNQKITSF
jgi:hypothetical protein